MLSLRSLIPALDWLRGYPKDWLRADVTAGLTAAAVVIPKGMAYAAIAGLPLQVGLYTALIPMVIYAFLGTSRTLSVTTTTTIAILTGAELREVMPGAGTTALIAAGRMEAPGLEEVERARRDGRWKSAYDSARTSKVPPDLAAALSANRRAAAFFAELDGANRYAILWRLQTAKRPETRAKRLAKFVAMLARHERIHALPAARAHRAPRKRA